MVIVIERILSQSYILDTSTTLQYAILHNFTSAIYCWNCSFGRLCFG